MARDVPDAGDIVWLEVDPQAGKAKGRATAAALAEARLKARAVIGP